MFFVLTRASLGFSWCVWFWQSFLCPFLRRPCFLKTSFPTAFTGVESAECCSQRYHDHPATAGEPLSGLLHSLSIGLSSSGSEPNSPKHLRGAPCLHAAAGPAPGRPKHSAFRWGSLQKPHGAAGVAQLCRSWRWQQIVLCSVPGSFPVSILVVSSSALLPACAPCADSPAQSLFIS